jgi:hypothetical protein
MKKQKKQKNAKIVLIFHTNINYFPASEQKWIPVALPLLSPNLSQLAI